MAAGSMPKLAHHGGCHGVLRQLGWLPALCTKIRSPIFVGQAFGHLTARPSWPRTEQDAALLVERWEGTHARIFGESARGGEAPSGDPPQFAGFRAMLTNSGEADMALRTVLSNPFRPQMDLSKWHIQQAKGPEGGAELVIDPGAGSGEAGAQWAGSSSSIHARTRFRRRMMSRCSSGLASRRRRGSSVTSCRSTKTVRDASR